MVIHYLNGRGAILSVLNDRPTSVLALRDLIKTKIKKNQNNK